MTSHLLAELFSGVVALTWRASWLIVVLVVLRLAVRGRVPAQAWFAVWLIVALRLLIPFSLPTGWSPYNFAASPPGNAAGSPASVPPLVNASVAPATAPTVLDTAASHTPTPLPNTPGTLSSLLGAAPKWSPEGIFAMVWILGIALLATARLAGSWRFRRQLQGAAQVADRRVVALVESELKRVGKSGRFRLLETGAVDAPALYGFAHPRLLLPPGLTAKLSDEELRYVVRHELGHLRRRDLLAHGLMQVAVALHWFNPLVWLSARLARADCELACDEFVLQRELPGGTSAYGATLLKVLGVVGYRRRPVAVVAMLEGREQLAQRIRMIADYRPSTLGRVMAGVVMVAILAVASLTRESRAEGQQTTPVPKPVSTSPTKPVEEATTSAVAGTPPVVNDAPLTTEVDQRVEAERKAKTLDWLKEQVDQQRQKVDRLARELQDYKEQKRMVSGDQLRNSVSEALRALSLEVQHTEAVKSAAEIRLNQVKEYKARGADLKDLPFIANQPLVIQLIQQLAAARISVENLRQKYLEAHPATIAATNALAATEQELQRAVDAACRQVEAECEEARRNSDRAQNAYEKAKSDALVLDRDAAEYNVRARALQVNTQILQSIMARARAVDDSPLPDSSRRDAAIRPSPDFTVSVMGEVNQQGAIAFSAKDNPIVLDVIARAGGFTSRANRGAVRIIHSNADGSRTEATLTAEVLMTGTSPELHLHGGDIVVVPELPRAVIERTVSVAGQVKRPGLFQMGAENLLLRDLLLKAGGLTETGNGKKVRLTRFDPVNRSTKIFTIDVEAALRGEPEPGSDAATWTLEAGDIVFVPERIIDGAQQPEQQPTRDVGIIGAQELKSRPAPDANAKNTIVIGIDTDGVASIDGKKVTDDQLIARLREIYGVAPSASVVIKADEKTQFKWLTAVMDSCHKVGFNRLNLQSR